MMMICIKFLMQFTGRSHASHTSNYPYPMDPNDIHILKILEKPDHDRIPSQRALEIDVVLNPVRTGTVSEVAWG